ncbi:chondroitin sulfate synthase 1-like [Oppia nitens]|uniref:chondroitin sulfate synthase 1-like n=1 Tax=Oppia nitens TaxID=1686743 RepID=UPI0023DB68D1|nr:chondroitin sulfate synthase 1-like [Oppia nitens]
MKELKQKGKVVTNNLVQFLSGIVIGFTICSQMTTFRYHWTESPFCSGNQNRYQLDDKIAELDQLVDSINKKSDGQNLVLIGVMTAEKYLDTRALSIYQTWAQNLKGRIIFFSSSSSRSSHGLPLVALPTVDDSYPPQKKSFLMFKFMSDHFIDKFEYFMRADDDVYVNTEKLDQFLRSVNSSKPQFIGQAGVGNKEEFGRLSLESNENFCMGGPGVIMSSTTLEIFAKRIPYCLKHLYSTHEDVEIGRCVRHAVGIPCTWSYEMQQILQHNITHELLVKEGTVSAKQLNKPITIHPIKQPSTMRALHNHYKNIEHQKTRHELNQLYRNLFKTTKYLNITVDDILSKLNSKYLTPILLGQPIDFNSLTKRPFYKEWDFISHNLFSATNINPKRHIESHIWRSIENSIQDIMANINRQSKQKGRTMEYKNLYYGYMRVDPLIGVEYILDLLLVYKRYRGRRMVIPVRRHAYAVQTFSQMQIREMDSCNQKEIVNIIVPLSGRIEAFIRFLDNFKEVHTKDPFISLAIVSFPDVGQTSDQMNQLQALLSDLKRSGIDIQVAQLAGFFSRAAALQRGSSMFPNDSLLLFLDVDMHFTDQVIARVRLNTIHGKQIYFPIVFSQYSLKFISESNVNNVDISGERGYWRQFGFGIVSIFKSDLQSVGGFNVSIHGWGMEDVNLYDRIIHSNFTIFRSIDHQLVHIYHDIHCDHSLTSIQYEMCLGTKLSSLGSVQKLAKYINQNKFLKL